MSITKKADAMFEVRWREGGRNRSLVVHGAFELAKKIERKKLSTRDENRHLDIRREVNFKMSELIDRYWAHYGEKKLLPNVSTALWRTSGRSLAECSCGKSMVSLSDGGTKA